MKKLLSILLALSLIILPVSTIGISAETVEDDSPVITRNLLRSSSIVDMTVLSLTKNSCSLSYFLISSTGNGTANATLQRSSGSGWVDVAYGSNSYSNTSTTSVSISVSSLPAGTYRVKTQISRYITGEGWIDTIYTGSKTLN